MWCIALINWFSWIVSLVFGCPACCACACFLLCALGFRFWRCCTLVGGVFVGCLCVTLVVRYLGSIVATLIRGLGFSYVSCFVG